jgi:hypothetical protein
MKFRFSCDVTLPFGQYESSLNHFDSIVCRDYDNQHELLLSGAIL